MDDKTKLEQIAILNGVIRKATARAAAEAFPQEEQLNLSAAAVRVRKQLNDDGSGWGEYLPKVQRAMEALLGEELHINSASLDMSKHPLAALRIVSTEQTVIVRPGGNYYAMRTVSTLSAVRPSDVRPATDEQIAAFLDTCDDDIFGYLWDYIGPALAISALLKEDEGTKPAEAAS